MSGEFSLPQSSQDKVRIYSFFDAIQALAKHALYLMRQQPRRVILPAPTSWLKKFINL